jgi:hypothetical protein
VTALVDQLEVLALRGGHDRHAHVVRQFGECLGDAVDLDCLGPQVLLVVGVPDLTQPVDGAVINPSRLGPGPGACALAHVSEVLLRVQQQAGLG